MRRSVWPAPRTSTRISSGATYAVRPTGPAGALATTTRASVSATTSTGSPGATRTTGGGGPSKTVFREPTTPKSWSPARTVARPSSTRTRRSRSSAGRLHRRAAKPGPDGAIVAVDAASAGWSYLDFAAYRLRPGQPASRPADDRERLVLVLEGRAAVRAGDHDFGVVGSRETVFDGPPPPVVLVAPGLPVEVVAETDALVVGATYAVRPT